MILAPHNTQWAIEFIALRDVFTSALGDLLLRVEHIGSTAVPGLQAKPILDIDLVIRDYAELPEIIAGLRLLGYTHHGDQGIPYREVFKPHDDTAPFTVPQRRWMQHHLYACPVGSSELHRHIAFRDGLRARADVREEYETLKLSIACRAGSDRKKYAQIKEAECRSFVENALRERNSNKSPVNLE